MQCSYVKIGKKGGSFTFLFTYKEHLLIPQRTSWCIKYIGNYIPLLEAEKYGGKLKATYILHASYDRGRGSGLCNGDVDAN